jgi:hypothetical protein
MTADILGVKINGEQFDISYLANSNQFFYTIACGLKDESVFVEIIIGGYAACMPATAFVLYANQPQQVTVATADNQTKTYFFVAEKSLPSDIFVQRGDILAINNDPANNGGYIFTGFEWYKNGNPFANETKDYIRLSSPGEYMARLTGRFVATQQNITINTCPVIISDIPDMQTKTAEISNISTISAVYPNPVGRGKSVRVEIDIAAEEQKEAMMQVLGMAGNIIATQNLPVPVAEIAMPDTPGMYILQVTVNGTVETFKVIVE